MKKASFVLLLVLLFGACKKNANPNPPAPIPDPTSEKYPQYWILTVAGDPGRYVYLRTNGNNMFRKNIDTTYSMFQLAIDDNCKFEISESRNEANNKSCVKIRLDKNKKIWCGITTSSNRQELHMTATTFNSENMDPDPGDGYKFIIHAMPKENGIKTVVIESIEKPGWYISSSAPGFNYAQNQLTLQQATSPERATRWQCR